MDTLFVSYIKKGEDIGVRDVDTIKILVALDKSIKIISIDTNEIDHYKPPWYIAKKNQFENDILKMDIENKKVLLYKKDPFAIIKENHKNRWKGMKTDTAMFSSVLDSAAEKLSTFNKYDEVPTIYTYPCVFTQQYDKKKWNYTIGGIVERHTRQEPVSPAFTDSVRKLWRQPFGRYTVGVKMAQLNTYLFFDNSITATSRKYKFMTHVGASFGIMFDGSDKETYLDAFFIRHWGGAFLGLSLWDKNIKHYFEGGAYIGPCNYFYFKAGIAYIDWADKKIDIKHKNQVLPLLGAGLIIPYVQFDAGYNFATKTAYITTGLNYPFNR
jgi:hypothetical protein